ncbi:MAG: hypothetical protein ACKOEW_05260, partial [Methylocystis sp.]
LILICAGVRKMHSDDPDFKLRPGKIRSRSGDKHKLFFNEVISALTKQGGGGPSQSRRAHCLTPGRSPFGRGRNLYGKSLFSSSSRRVTIKARALSKRYSQSAASSGIRKF